MSGATDNYDITYADKLWDLLPAIYRTLDTDDFDPTLNRQGGSADDQRQAKGPLRELVNRHRRAGGDPAPQHRSDVGRPVDRDLRRLAYPLYRRSAWHAHRSLRWTRGGSVSTSPRRSTTVAARARLAILEEIASTSPAGTPRWSSSSAGLGRTRHGLDPEIGLAYAADDDDVVAAARGRTGRRRIAHSIGGFADLRNA